MAILPPSSDGWFIQREDKVSGRTGMLSNPYTFGLMLGYIRSLTPNVDLKAVDCQADRITLKKAQYLIQRFNPDLLIVFASAFCLSSDRILAEPRDSTVLCLTPANVDTIEAIKNYSLKSRYYTYGEIPFTVAKLVNVLSTGDDLESVPGLVIRKNDRLVFSSPPFFENLVNAPLPAYDLLPMQKYDDPFMINTAKACPFQCTFCCESVSAFPRFTGKPVSMRTPQQVLQELTTLVYKYRRNKIFFMDNEFALDMKRAKEICRLLIDGKVPLSWSCMNRVDLMDEELVQLMRQANCTRIAFGIESGDPMVRNNMRKHTTNAQIEEAFRLCKKYGIKAHAFLIVGAPGETEKTLVETVRLLRAIQPSSIDISVLYPSPNSILYRELLQSRALMTLDWEKYKPASTMLFEHNYYKSIRQIEYVKQRIMNEFFRMKSQDSKGSKRILMLIGSLAVKSPLWYVRRVLAGRPVSFSGRLYMRFENSLLG